LREAAAAGIMPDLQRDRIACSIIETQSS
jgi:hypothetical protein